MKQLNEQIERIRVLMEVEIKQKKRLGGGGISHQTYQSNRDPDSVYKIGWNRKFNDDGDYVDETTPVDTEHIRIFKKYPKYFPIVKSVGVKHVELEKLNTSKVYEDAFNIGEDLRNNNFRFQDPMEFLYRAKPFVLEKLLNVSKHRELIMKYVNLVRDVENEVGSDIGDRKRFTVLDVHMGQFGYDKNGNLKMLDF